MHYKNLAGWQTTQLGKKKQGNCITQKANILSFQGTTALFALQQGVFVQCDGFSAKCPS